MVGGYYMPFTPHYAFSTHPPLPLHPKVPRPWVLDMYMYVLYGIVIGRNLFFPPTSSDGSEKGEEAGRGERTAGASGSRGRKRVWCGTHFCFFQRHVYTCHRLVWQVRHKCSLCASLSTRSMYPCFPGYLFSKNLGSML